MISIFKIKFPPRYINSKLIFYFNVIVISFDKSDEARTEFKKEEKIEMILNFINNIIDVNNENNNNK